MINILDEGNIIVLVDSNDNTKYYEIEKSRFEETIHNNLSDWILQLDNKSWMHNNTCVLYQLAAIICKECPMNTIDWYTTFLAVEKGNYLDLLADSLLPKEKGSMEYTLKIIKFNREQSTPENHKIVENIVNQKLSNYHLN